MPPHAPKPASGEGGPRDECCIVDHGYSFSHTSTSPTEQEPPRRANNGSADSNAAQVNISITEPNAGPPPVKPAFTSPNTTTFIIGTPKTFTITTIRDVTPIPHTGCRPPKRRRV